MDLLLMIILLLPSYSLSCEDIDLTEFKDLVRDCSDSGGPVLNCTGPMFDHLSALQRLDRNWTELKVKIVTAPRYESLKNAYNASSSLGKVYGNNLHLLMFTFEGRTNISGEKCVNLKYINDMYFEMFDYVEQFEPLRCWIDYYLPVICSVELVFGILANLSIVLVYLRHSDMRTAPNKVVLNLAVGDILLLINNVALYYVRFRWMPLDISDIFIGLMAYGRTVAVGCSVYSMVVLSLLRYLVTVYPESRLLDHIHSYLILGVWIVAAVVGIPDAVFHGNEPEFYSGEVAKYVHLVFLCLVPLCIICGLSLVTSRVIRASVGQLPAGLRLQRRSRQRGATVILYLSLLLCITYLPMNLYEIFVTRFTWQYHYIFLVRVLLPINSCLNPVVLFVASQRYREYLVKFICHTLQGFRIKNTISAWSIGAGRFRR